MADPNLIQHAPSLMDLVGYYVNTYAPALAAPIMYGVKKAYDVANNIQTLMEKQNELLTKLLAGQNNNAPK